MDIRGQKPLLGTPLIKRHPLARGLVGCWLMNEGTGDSLFNEALKLKATLAEGSAVWSAGQFGHAINTSSSAFRQSSSPLLTTTPLTIMAWIKSNQLTTDHVPIGVYKDGTDDRFILDLNGFGNGEVLALCKVTTSTYATATKSVELNKWHQVAGVFVSSVERYAYIDGGNRGSNTTAQDPVGMDKVVIGADYNLSVNFDGLVGYVLIWNRALSAAEIASLHRDPFQMFEREPIELWAAATSVDVTVTPATLALASTQHAPAISIGNDFSGDSDCKAVWDFESGASFIEDSKGGNDLSNAGADEDTTDYKQGACSARFVRASADRMYIVDANLDSGFPLKSGETNKTVSFAFWLYLETTGVNQYLIRKTSASNYSIIIYVSSTNRIILGWSSNGSAWDTANAHASALSASTWYHVTCTRDDSDNSYRIRIWDDTAQAILGIDKTGTGGNIYVGTGVVILGNNDTDLAPDGNEDEVVVFDRALSVADIDAIRAGTYSGADATVTPTTLQLALTQETPAVVFPLQTVLPDTFQLALTLETPAITTDIVIVPAAFALALTQHAPGFSLGHTVSIDAPLALALTSQVPIVAFPLQTALPDPFSLALALEAPTILKNTLTWSAGLLTYKGVTYEISAGITQKRFVYWDPNYTTMFRDTDVLQDVFDADGWVMCLNESGVAYPAFARKLIHGGIIQAGTITAEYGQIAALTVGEAELKDLSVNSAKIGDLQVSSAKIADLTVGTGKITADAITKAAEDFDAAEQDCGSGTTNVAACSITLVTGGFVKIEASVTLAFDALNTTISVRVRRTGDSVDTLYLSNSIAWIGGGNASFAPLLSDSPGPGSYTYTLAVISTDANVHAYNACIIVQQFKK